LGEEFGGELNMQCDELGFWIGEGGREGNLTGTVEQTPFGLITDFRSDKIGHAAR
jgi:hypothetical protein